MDNPTIQIGNRLIGAGQPCFIIAEVGANHNRIFENAAKLIDLAAEAGADAVKFQSYRAETLYSRFTPRLKEMDGKARPNESPFDLIKRIETPYEWHKPLKAHCERRGVIFMSSPFDLEAVDDLEKAGAPAYKIASSELTDMVLIQHVARKKKPVILSTGKSTLGDVEAAIAWVRGEGNDAVAVLHCVSQYPSLYEDINLAAIPAMRSAFDLPVGFSDHALDNVAAVGAVALGACMLEKHVTLDRGMEGPDHKFALEPAQLRELVSSIRALERAMGTGVKRVMESEKESRRLANRSLHARRPIPKGKAIAAEDLITKRPALGIEPRHIAQVLGRTARRDIGQDEWITWEMI